MATDSTDSADDDSPDGVSHVDQEAVFDDVVGANPTVLVDFHADWCGPCQMMAPLVEELATETEVPVVKVDVDELPQVAARYDVSSIPTFVVFDDGEATNRLVGMQEKTALTAALE